jgi:Tfp pilus tip-associated adhesin PilY1
VKSCDPGGQSWLMTIPAVTGGTVTIDAVYKEALFLNDTSLTLPPRSAASASSASAGSASSGASSSAPGCNMNGKLLKAASTGELEVDNAALDCSGYGRQSWRQTR